MITLETAPRQLNINNTVNAVEKDKSAYSPVAPNSFSISCSSDDTIDRMNGVHGYKCTDRQKTY